MGKLGITGLLVVGILAVGPWDERAALAERERGNGMTSPSPEDLATIEQLKQAASLAYNWGLAARDLIRAASTQPAGGSGNGTTSDPDNGPRPSTPGPNAPVSPSGADPTPTDAKAGPSAGPAETPDTGLTGSQGPVGPAESTGPAGSPGPVEPQGALAVPGPGEGKLSPRADIAPDAPTVLGRPGADRRELPLPPGGTPEQRREAREHVLKAIEPRTPEERERQEQELFRKLAERLVANERARTALAGEEEVPLTTHVRSAANESAPPIVAPTVLPLLPLASAGGSRLERATEELERLSRSASPGDRAKAVAAMERMKEEFPEVATALAAAQAVERNADRPAPSGAPAPDKFLGRSAGGRPAEAGAPASRFARVAPSRGALINTSAFAQLLDDRPQPQDAMSSVGRATVKAMLDGGPAGPRTELWIRLASLLARLFGWRAPLETPEQARRHRGRTVAGAPGGRGGKFKRPSLLANLLPGLFLAPADGAASAQEATDESEGTAELAGLAFLIFATGLAAGKLARRWLPPLARRRARQTSP